jgi:hypothetical protein
MKHMLAFLAGFFTNLAIFAAAFYSGVDLPVGTIPRTGADQPATFRMADGCGVTVPAKFVGNILLEDARGQAFTVNETDIREWEHHDVTATHPGWRLEAVKR